MNQAEMLSRATKDGEVRAARIKAATPGQVDQLLKDRLAAELSLEAREFKVGDIVQRDPSKDRFSPYRFPIAGVPCVVLMVSDTPKISTEGSRAVCESLIIATVIDVRNDVPELIEVEIDPRYLMKAN